MLSSDEQEEFAVATTEPQSFNNENYQLEEPPLALPLADDQFNAELHFLLTLFLSASPCQETFKTFKREALGHGLLPTRLDWTGQVHREDFDQLVSPPL